MMSNHGRTLLSLLAFVLTTASAEAADDVRGDPLPPGAVARLGPARFWPNGSVWDLAFAPNGKSLAAAVCHRPREGVLVFWDADTGKEVRRLPREKPVNCLAFTPDGRSLVVADGSDRLHFLDPVTGQPHEQPAIVVKEGLIHRFSFSADGKRLALVTGTELYFWNMETGQCLWTWRPRDSTIEGIACAPDGRSVATTSVRRDYSVVTLCETATGRVRREWSLPDSRLPLRSVHLAFSPQGEPRLAAVTGETLFLWDTTDGHEVLKTQSEGPVLFTRDGKSLIGAGREILNVWDASTGTKRGTWEGPADDWGGALNALALSPDGKSLAAARLSSPLHFWKLPEGARVRRFPAHDSDVSIVAWSPDGRTVATGSYDRTVRLWDAATGRPLHCLRGPQRYITLLAFSPDGRAIAAASRRRDEMVHVWDVASGKELHQIGGHEPGVGGLAFTADGKSLLTAGVQGELQAWTLATGQGKPRLQGAGLFHRIGGFWSSPNGRFLVTGGSTIRTGELTVWSAATEELLFRLKPDAPPEEDNKLADIYEFTEVAFSADSKWLLTSESHFGRFSSGPVGFRSFDPAIRIWEMATGKEIFRIGPDGKMSIYTLSLSADNRFLATNGNGEDRLFVWDLLTGSEVRGHGIGYARALAFSPDGRFLAARHADNTVLIWDTQRWRERPLPFAVSQSNALWQQHWQALGSDDGPRAFAAMQTLRATPDATVDFFWRRLRPTAAANERHVARLIADLESDRFAVRRDATAELEEVVDLAAPALRAARTAAPGLETSRRLERLLQRAEQIEALPTGLRAARAVAVLEGINSPEARTVLGRWAEGAPDAVLTRQAREALQRLDRTSAAK